MTIKISIMAHCRDTFSLMCEDPPIDYDGYVPGNIGIGGGDDVELEIDLETGQILNWNSVSKKQLLESLEEAGYEPANVEDEDE